MNAKENARRTIQFEQPERVVIGPPEHKVNYWGLNHEGYAGGSDSSPVGTRWIDIWGVGWHKEQPGIMGFPEYHPLADLPATLKDYVWPDPDDEHLTAQIYAMAEGWNKETDYLTGNHRGTLWEKCYMMTGMENLMIYFFTEPEAVRELFHRMIDFQLGIARHYLAAGIEMVRMGDDLGTQKNLILSPRLIRDFLLPEYRRLFSFYTDHGVLINFHSCGHILPMIDTFIDLGVNILNPIQATANNLDDLRSVTQGRLALQGGVSSGTMLDGPPEAIREEVALRIRQLGQNSGYFCAPDQSMLWPEGHYQVYLDAVEEFGLIQQ
jgi:uroporphyrinogen decarboxylase